MNKGVGALLLIVIFAAAGILGWKYYQPTFLEHGLRSTSDAVSDSKVIRVAGDDYFGYFFFVSPEMRKQAARNGLRLDFTDDGGAYADRFAKFAKGEYDIVLAPVKENIQHGGKHKFPGVIKFSIGDSKGADGIVGFSNVLATGNLNTDLNDPNLRIVYIKDSPGEFLLDLTITHFDLFNLRQSNEWRVEVGSIKEVLAKAKRREGDVFVLWEPGLSEALEIDGMRYIWGSDKFSGLISDVAIFRRDFVKNNRDTEKKLMQTYFRVLAVYANNPDMLVEDLRQVTGRNKATVEQMIKKIDWFDLRENCVKQFGIEQTIGEGANEGVIDAIMACTDILIRSGKLEADPTRGDPYLLIDSSLLEELARASAATAVPAVAQKASYRNMSDQEWQNLREVGTMRVEPITFQFGDDGLDERGKETVDRIAVMLKNNYPNPVSVRGHTSPGPQEDANILLSLKRAQAVAQYLIAVHHIDPNRLNAEGYGASQPPAKKPQENERSYRYRFSRVEFVLRESRL